MHTPFSRLGTLAGMLMLIAAAGAAQAQSAAAAAAAAADPTLAKRPGPATPALPAQAVPAGPAVPAFYQDLGGKEGTTALVAEFVRIMLADPRVAATFEGVDMDRLHDKLAEQFCVASGGPCQYTGKSMAEVHEDLKVNNAQFNASVEDLQLAMERRGIASRVQNRLLSRLAPTQHAIVTK